MSFQCSDECEESFQKLKTLLTSAPVLTPPEDGVDFTCIVMLQESVWGRVNVEEEGDCLCF